MPRTNEVARSPVLRFSYGYGDWMQKPPGMRYSELWVCPESASEFFNMPPMFPNVRMQIVALKEPTEHSLKVFATVTEEIGIGHLRVYINNRAGGRGRYVACYPALFGFVDKANNKGACHFEIEWWRE